MKNINKNPKIPHSYSQSSFNDKVHNLFEKIVIENTLRNELYLSVNSLNYKKVEKMFNRDILHQERVPDINSKYKEGNTVLHISASKNFLEMSTLLIDLNASIDSTNNKQRTPLHLASMSNNIKIVDLLLSSGADINCMDYKNYTPLMYSTILGYDELTELLLVHNADVSIKNIYNETCFDNINNKSTYDIFKKYFSQKEFDKFSSKYKRTFMFGKMKSRHNSRKDLYLQIGYKLKVYTDLIRNSNSFRKSNNIANKNDKMFSELPRRLELTNFEIQDLLGKGGFGEVYLVKLKNTDNYYALKAIDKKRIFKENVKKYVENERKVYEKFHSPFIVKFYRAFQSNYYLYLLIEHMQNGDLKRYIKKYKTFTEKDVRIISAQLILAIEHLHKKGIIYRDLKPDNILIDSEGYIKLADFGLCKDGIVGNFESKSFCGSVAYLPPEVINRTGHGRAVDWYLLGTVIYEMLVGFPPYFTTMGRTKLVDNIQNAQLKFYNRNLSSEVMNLIRGLLDRDITKRIGASLRDSQEVKEHPFYKGLNFECIYNKEFIPPKCLQEKIENASKKRDESQWYCNKDLKNDMKINNENNNNQNIDNINPKENNSPNKQKIIMNKIDFWDYEGII